MAREKKNNNMPHRQRRKLYQARRMAREARALVADQKETATENDTQKAASGDGQEKAKAGVEPSGDVSHPTYADVGGDAATAETNDHDDSTSIENDGVIQEKTKPKKQYGLDAVAKQVKRTVESMRRRLKRLEETVASLKETVQMQATQIAELKAREEQLQSWVDKTQEALDVLLRDRTGDHPGAFRSKSSDFWYE